jgi:hypothetical protein
MAQKEQLTEDIKYLTEILKLLWITIIALTGGVAGLVLTELGFRQVAIGIGTSVMLLMIVTAGFIHRRVRTKIQQLQEV